MFFFFFFQAEDGIRDYKVTGVQTCALPISRLWELCAQLHPSGRRRWGEGGCGVQGRRAQGASAEVGAGEAQEHRGQDRLSKHADYLAGEEVNTMMDLSSFVDGGLAILGTVASILLAGWTITSHSSTVSAPANASRDHRAFDRKQLEKAA